MLAQKHLTLLTLLLAAVLVGCSGSPTPAPPPQETTSPEAAPPETPPSAVSPTAHANDAALAAQETAKAPEAKPTLPADHWLAATAIKDTLPATIAPEAPRKLIRESGPAYLEAIGNTRVLHLKGTHYEMGLQHGTLMKEEITQASTLVHTLGPLGWKGDFAQSIAEAWERTSPFIPEKYKEEMRGLAEATGLPIEQIREFTIFPELFHCSGFAVWGKATEDGALLHGRVLDYMRDAGLDQWALIIVQEPEGANAFVNVAYAGMLGSVTGMNAQQIGLGEMGGRGEGDWDGMPMTFLVRECLEQASTLDEARAIMENTPRTCQYYYVISDAKADNGRGSALGVAAEPSTITFVKPNEAHPQLARPVEDAVLLSAGDRYNCLVDRVEQMYGKITPQIALDIMARGVAMNSNMHDALFRPASLELWVTNSTIESPACNLPYVHYNLRTLLDERPSE